MFGVQILLKSLAMLFSLLYIYTIIYNTLQKDTSNSESNESGDGSSNEGMSDEDFNDLLESIGESPIGGGSDDTPTGGNSMNVDNVPDGMSGDEIEDDSKSKSSVQLSDRQKDLLKKKIEKQKKFMNGDIQKTTITKTDSKNLNAIEESGSEMKEVGKEPATLVADMLASGIKSFYIIKNGATYYYDIIQKKHIKVPGQDSFIILNNIRKSKEVFKNSGCVVEDLGEGILNVEFQSKMNTIGGDVLVGLNKAIDIAEKDFSGLVVGNQGANFSVGANIGMIFMMAVEQEYDELNMAIKYFQDSVMSLRYSSIPTVVAPQGMTLGGGCEINLHADKIVAHSELYMGLVEVGVGLIPAGGGTKEMALRMGDARRAGDVELNRLQEAFMNIATARVSTSAHEAREMNYLRAQDRIVLNRNQVISEAKREALALADAGYVQKARRNDVWVEGKQGLALFKAGIQGMLMGRYISEHDALIANKLAYAICGGDLDAPQVVSETYLLDLEREAFLSLCGEKKTMDRIQSLLGGGKPLRN